MRIARVCATMVKMKVKVYAKLNLTLAVGARQGRFHPIDSVVTSVDVFDEVEVQRRADSRVSVCCDGIAPEQNSAYRAAKAFQREFSTDGVSIFVKKGIPLGAGMGGSSADAAAVVYCMCKLFGFDVRSEKVHELCAELGSDVNFMLRGGYARMRGKGDDLDFGNLLQQLYFAVTVFDAQLLAADVYAKFDEEDGESKLPVYPDGILGPFEMFAGDVSRLSAEQAEKTSSLLRLMFEMEMFGAQCYNDLEWAATQLDDYAAAYCKFVSDKGYKCTMTGSGSSYFIPFTRLSNAKRAVKTLANAGFNSFVCRSVLSGIEEI